MIILAWVIFLVSLIGAFGLALMILGVEELLANILPALLILGFCWSSGYLIVTYLVH